VREHRELVDAAWFSIPTRRVELEHGRAWWPMWKPRKRSIPIFRLRLPIAAAQFRPRPDNAIYELTTALNKLAATRFPLK